MQVGFNGQKVTPDTICIISPGDETALYLLANHMMTACCFEQTLLEETLHVIGSTTPLKTIVRHTTLLALPPDVVAPCGICWKRHHQHVLSDPWKSMCSPVFVSRWPRAGAAPTGPRWRRATIGDMCERCVDTLKTTTSRKPSRFKLSANSRASAPGH